ncbi:MAG: class I SAM-dependent methyltransferase [Candidatus Paceibacterota bacterium]
MDQTKYQYNKIGNEYIEGQDSFFSERKDLGRDIVANIVGDIRGKKILDVGCGGGVDLKIFEGKGADVYGIDPSEVMVGFSKQRVKKPGNIQIGEYENIPFPDHSFDTIFGRFSLHYLKQLDKAYQEIYRVLIPGGQLFQIVSHPAFDLIYLLREENKNQGLVTIKLYDNEVKVSFPPHTLRDYFSPLFFKFFDLSGINEYGEEELKDKEQIIPGALLYCAKARR